MQKHFNFKRGVSAFAVSAVILVASSAAAGEKIPVVAKDPYAGAIVVDVATGKVIHEENADAQLYPASIVKLMDLLIALELVEKGQLSLTNKVVATAEAARMGGTEVFLKEGEVWTVDDLLYAMMVQSANDAAVALAIHVAGTKAGFVELMNKRAQELGMKSTTFHSVHGLPPETSKGQMPDVTTPRDLVKLAMELVKRKETFRYTATVQRVFRPGESARFNHNRLLRIFDGCDGLKTGYITAAGFSVVATAQRNGRRLIAVVMGSKGIRGLVRDEEAKRLLAKGFLNLPPLRPTPVPPAATNAVPTNPPVAVTNAVSTKQPPAATAKEGGEKPPRRWKRAALIVGLSILAAWVIGSFVVRSRRTEF